MINAMRSICVSHDESKVSRTLHILTSVFEINSFEELIFSMYAYLIDSGNTHLKRFLPVAFDCRFLSCTI